MELCFSMEQEVDKHEITTGSRTNKESHIQLSIDT